jgi:hypothetical protein
MGQVGFGVCRVDRAPNAGSSDSLGVSEVYRQFLIHVRP